MQLTENTILEIAKTGGISGLDEALGLNKTRIRFGDLPQLAQQVAQLLIDKLESGTLTKTIYKGDMGFRISVDGKLIHTVHPFTAVPKEANDLQTVVFTKGKILPKDGPSGGASLA